VVLFVLMVLADQANGHAVLPAFVLGLVMARHYQQHRQEQERLRVVAFAFLTPFFFLRGGLNVSLGSVLSAIVPTAIAQRWFSPDVAAEREAARAVGEAARRAGHRPIPLGDEG
jgi:hypothetical protein